MVYGHVDGNNGKANRSSVLIICIMMETMWFYILDLYGSNVIIKART